MVFENSYTLKQAEDMTKHTWVNPVRANTGSDLLALIEGGTNCITVTKDKFDNACRTRGARDRMKELSQNLLFIFDEINA